MKKKAQAPPEELFTPCQAMSSFACTHCERSLIPGQAVPASVIDFARRAGFSCYFCYVTNSDDFCEGIFDEAGAEWNISYREYLKTDQWKAIRTVAIEYAEGHCQVCNSDLMLQVHHRKYPSVLGTEKLSDLTVLCRRCHNVFHNGMKK